MVWIYGNRFLTESEMQNNAKIVYTYLKARGWTINAIAGMLGNMQTESSINPAIWQNLDYGNTSLGYGLVQWTPSTNYTNWANDNNYDITNGNYQLQWIDEETVNFGQWIATDDYNISFDSFKSSTETPEYLAGAFLRNFERAGVEVIEQRQTQARSWHTYLLNSGGSSGGNSGETDTTNKKHNSFNFILFNHRRREQQWRKQKF